MTHHIRTTSLMGLISLSLIGATSTPALATTPSGKCMKGANGASNCQFEVKGYTQAPAIATSKGIRLNSGQFYVLFNNYPIGPRFVSNSSGNDLFVPQGTAGEFSAFLGASVKGVKIDYAVVPTTYTAMPACTALSASPTSIKFSIPEKDTTTPVVVSLYTLVNNPAKPATTQKIIGSTDLKKSSAEFTFSRKDCTSDNQGNKLCNNVSYIEDQQLVFSAKGKTPTFTWGDPSVTNALYVKINDGAFKPAKNCTTKYAPALNGKCGSSNGQTLSSAPSASTLCSWGNAGSISGTWSWKCNGVNGGNSASCSASKAVAPPPSTSKPSSKPTSTPSTPSPAAPPCTVGVNWNAEDCASGGNNDHGYYWGPGCPGGGTTCNKPQK